MTPLAGRMCGLEVPFRAFFWVLDRLVRLGFTENAQLRVQCAGTPISASCGDSRPCPRIAYFAKPGQSLLCTSPILRVPSCPVVKTTASLPLPSQIVWMDLSHQTSSAPATEPTAVGARGSGAAGGGEGAGEAGTDPAARLRSKHTRCRGDDGRGKRPRKGDAKRERKKRALAQAAETCQYYVDDHGTTTFHVCRSALNAIL